LTANQWIAEEVRTSSFPERIMTLIERGDAYVALPGGTGTLAELALAWEMMNKASLSRTVGGKKPLLVTAPYWQPVIECLKQEDRLAALGPSQPWRALDVITMVTNASEAVKNLRNWFGDKS
jgi:predicted Rossmann-fold nucleotide-binding protein